MKKLGRFGLIRGRLRQRKGACVGLMTVLAGVGLSEGAELDTQGWQEEHERPWHVSEAQQLARPAAYDSAFFAAALAALPQTWEYAEQDGEWLPLLDCMVKYVPQPVPVTLWTSRADATCWVGRVRIEYDGPGEAYARLYSPWSCLRVSGQWRAESFSVPPGGTNILITYLPGLRRAEDTNAWMWLEDDQRMTNKIAVRLDDVSESEVRALTPRGQRRARWRRVAAEGESPRGLMWSVGQHAMVCAQRAWQSPLAQDAVLRIGSDDAVRVWVNNREVFRHPRHSGYTREEHGVRVRLEQGTNYVLCALVNGGGPAQLGVRLYPCEAPIEGGLLFNDTQAYAAGGALYDGCPGGDVEWQAERVFDFLWMNAAGSDAQAAVRRIAAARDCWRTRPSVVPAPWRPCCEHVRIVRSADGAEVFAAGPVTQFPLRVTMAGQPDGVYRCVARWGGRLHVREFYHGDAVDLSPSQRMMLHVARHENAFEPSRMYALMEQPNHWVTNDDGTARTMLRAFVSRRDGTVQPYVLHMPGALHTTTGAALIVNLKIALPMSVEDWCGGMLRRGEYVPGGGRALVITPYARGARLYTGLAEADVLDALDDALRYTCADAARVYMTGDSLGGHGCWSIGARYPDRFAALLPRGGLDARLWRNLLNLPLWHVHGELDNPEHVRQTVGLLREHGADAHVTIEAGKLHTEMNFGTAEDVAAWMLEKRRAEAPGRVVFQTVDHANSAYWLREIVPRRYGRDAMIDARWDAGGARGSITVQAHNVRSFVLDVRVPALAAVAEWNVVAGTQLLQCVRGGSVSTVIVDRVAAASGGGPARGLWGGFAGLVEYGLVIVYAGGVSGTPARAAYALRDGLSGRGIWQFDSVFPVVSERELTQELCAGKNVLLFAAHDEKAVFLTRHAARLPFSIEEDGIALGGRTGTSMACVCPNPLAPERYLCTIIGMAISAEALQSARCDVVLDGMSGSFDAAWREVAWDDTDEHAACGEGCTHCGHGGGEVVRAADEERGVLWRRYGAGLVVVALGVAWWLSRSRMKAVNE